MSGGVGRGRGWLNLKAQAQSTKTPGLESNNTSSPPIVNDMSSPNYNSEDNRTFSDVTNDYDDLISKIKQLNVSDDGIKFNQKIKYIIESWNQDCQNGVDVQNSFDAIHKASLADTDVANKLVHLIASRTFLSQEIHKQNIRLMFVQKLQDNFEGCKQLQSLNPIQFRNSVYLMGEFFNKGRLAGGGLFFFMVSPLLTYLGMLLDSTDVEDLKLFTTQLYSNGSQLKENWPERMAEVIEKVRRMLCSDKKYTTECKLWLLLALEVSNNRFALLPTEINTFYQKHLGDQAMACFQGTHGTLTIETTSNGKTLHNVQSNVNVLQVSTDPPTDLSPHNSVPDFGTPANYNSSGSQCDTSQNCFPSKRDNHSDSNKGGNSGRPILGAGARLQKNRNQSADTGNNAESANWLKNKPQKDDNADSNWRDRISKKGSEQVAQKKEWEKKKTTPKVKKGWEHDDRFETDYS